MRERFKKLPIGLTAAALVLTASLAVGGAMGYFTTYSTASGGVTMNMGFTETVPGDDVDDDGKHVTVQNTGDYDCFVRVKAFTTLDSMSWDETASSGWTYNASDEYWYYSEILKAGETTPELLITYDLPEDTETQLSPEEFDIIVVTENTPVVYKADGTAYADWDYAVTNTTAEDAE